MPLATRRQDSCRSSFKMRGGWLSAALGKTLLWNSSFVYMDGGCTKANATSQPATQRRKRKREAGQCGKTFDTRGPRETKNQRTSAAVSFCTYEVEQWRYCCIQYL